MNSEEFFDRLRASADRNTEASHRQWLQNKLNEYLDGDEYVPQLDAAPFLDWVSGVAMQNTLRNSEED